ncbi:MAG: hypothetical protein ACNA8G_10575 [Gammaproteobacteria bacterium]
MKLAIDLLDDSLANQVKIMKVSEMLLWILGTTLLAIFSGAYSWGGHQRGEHLASFADVRQPAPVHWLSDAHADEAAPAGLADRSALPGTMGTVGIGDGRVLDDIGEPILTLVSCYALHFIDSEPQRYIVGATVPDRSM